MNISCGKILKSMLIKIKIDEDISKITRVSIILKKFEDFKSSFSI